VPSDYSVPGFGPANEILIQRPENKSVVKLHFAENSYHTIWEKLLPERMKHRSYKFFTADGRLILSDPCGGATCTQIYSSQLEQLQQTYDEEDYGYLRTISQQCLYYEAKSELNYKTRVYRQDNHQLVHTLTLPHGREWGFEQSMCYDEGVGNVVVIDQQNRTIDSFDTNGQYFYLKKTVFCHKVVVSLAHIQLNGPQLNTCCNK
jgi:hypothetical protein